MFSQLFWRDYVRWSLKILSLWSHPIFLCLKKSVFCPISVHTVLKESHCTPCSKDSLSTAHFAHFPRPGENDSYVSALSPRPAENSSSAISGKADCRSPAEISSFPEDEFWPSKGGAVFRLGRAGLAWIAAIWHDPVPAIGCSPSGEFYQTDPDLSSMPTVIIFFFPIKSESNSGWGLGDYLWS